MKSSVLIFLAISLAITANVRAEDQEIVWDADKGTVSAQANDWENEWNLGAGLRLNYLRLTGGFSGFSATDNATYHLDYSAIGMDNYAPSVALALAGKYKKWNLFFGASRGSYTGSFITKQNITIKDETIPAGSHVDGKIEMGIYSLSTTYALVKEPQHDVGIGLGFLILDMDTEFKTSTVTLGDGQIYPMPFLALSGRKKWGKYRLSAVGGGAYFDGEMDGLDYTVYYYTVDIKGGYEFYKQNHYTGVFSLGYRHLYMDSKATQTDGSWFEENDRYAGPFISVLVKFDDIIK